MPVMDYLGVGIKLVDSCGDTMKLFPSPHGNRDNLYIAITHQYDEDDGDTELEFELSFDDTEALIEFLRKHVAKVEGAKDKAPAPIDPTIRVGDTVTLRSGGPVMTVEECYDNDGEAACRCVHWCNNNVAFRQEEFPAAALVKWR